jgi:hypothetical protein
MTAVAFCCLTALLLPSEAADAAPGTKERDEQQRAERLEQMRALARSTKVDYQKEGHKPVLLDSPVFRYDDQPRRFLDATMWVWTDKGRPVAFEKVEAMPSQWQFCFTSLAADLLDVNWTGNHRYRSSKAGMEMRPLPNAPDVPARSSRRSLELRNLAREFSARIVVDGAGNSEEMRLLSTPIFEYTDPQSNLLTGAVFGFATNGTNPDLLLVLEARPEPEQGASRWHYAAARMTIGGVTLKHRENTVAEFEYVEPQPAGFPTWTFFSIPRPLTGDDTAEAAGN